MGNSSYRADITCQHPLREVESRLSRHNCASGSFTQYYLGNNDDNEILA
jgi:hypothetical protein